MYKLLLFPLLVLTLTTCQEEPAPAVMDTTPAAENILDEAPDSLLRHAVFFSFTEESTQEDIDRVQQAFSALPGKINAIHDYEWGTNNSPEELNKGFTHAFFVTFRSEDDREAYLPHPDHQAFVDVLRPHLQDVFVVDYWTRRD